VENGAGSPAARAAGESDLAEVAAMFAAHVSPELAVDLALEIVLNEIVEQACLATGADGAAVVLPRGAEWVCRATAGDHAPQLGAKLDAEAGLSGLCLQTRKVQRCDDAEADARADIEACRKLGVRSVIILPVLRNEELAGVFEVFSARPSAFGSRDERTLEALAQRVLKNLEKASETLTAHAEPAQSLGPEQLSEEKLVTQEGAPRYGINLIPITWALAVTVLAFAVLLTVRAVQRLGGARITAAAHPRALISEPSTSAGAQSASAKAPEGADSVTSGEQSAASKSSDTSISASSGAASPLAAARATDVSPPEGSLLVYENGKEVFRISPKAESHRPFDATGTSGTAVSGIQVSPEGAEGSLVYRVEPEYPEEALRKQMQGPVVLHVRTGRDGAIEEMRLISGQRLLADAAIAAVKQWRFRPRMVQGQPVEMETEVMLNFRLPR
jgi:TonB family protein